MKPTYEELEELIAVMLPCLRAYERGECAYRQHDIRLLEQMLMRIYHRDFDGCWTRSLMAAVDRVHLIERGPQRAYTPSAEGACKKQGHIRVAEFERPHGCVRSSGAEERKRVDEDDVEP